jgi:hypothetical protein
VSPRLACPTRTSSALFPAAAGPSIHLSGRHAPREKGEGDEKWRTREREEVEKKEREKKRRK